MKLAVIGSRTFTNYAQFKLELGIRKPDLIISGGATGADAMANRWAQQTGIPIMIFYPVWLRDGKGAALMRNTKIIDACDEVLAFWDGQSLGTLDSINKARKSGKPVSIVPFV